MAPSFDASDPVTTMSTKRFVVFTSDAGTKIGVNPDHVSLIEPRTLGTTIFLIGPGAEELALHRHVQESFDEVMRSLRDEARPRTVV
jgi:hypothetical protein